MKHSNLSLIRIFLRVLNRCQFYSTIGKSFGKELNCHRRDVASTTFGVLGILGNVLAIVILTQKDQYIARSLNL